MLASPSRLLESLLEPGTAPHLLVSEGPRVRWIFPLGDRHVLRSALSIYTPATLRAVAGWQASRAAVSLRLGRLLPGKRQHLEPPLAAEIASLLGVEAVRIAASSSLVRDRCTLAAIDRSGRILAFAKVARTHDGEGAGLDREAETLDRLAGHVDGVAVPSVVYRGPLKGFDVLVLTSVAGRPRPRPWRLDGRIVKAAADVFRLRDGTIRLGERLERVRTPDPAWAARIGRVREALGADWDRPIPAGLVHGDFSPWNLTLLGGHLGLVDWEEASFRGPPFWDLWTYVVQRALMTDRPYSRRAIGRALRALRGGPLRSAIRTYARLCGVSEEIARPVLLVFLAATGAEFQPGTGRHAPIREAVNALRATLLESTLEGTVGPPLPGAGGQG